MASQDVCLLQPSHAGCASAHCVFTQRDIDLHKDMQSGLNAHVLIGHTFRHKAHKRREIADTHSARLYKYAALVMIAKIYTLYILVSFPQKPEPKRRICVQIIHLGGNPSEQECRNRKQEKEEMPPWGHIVKVSQRVIGFSPAPSLPRNI